MEELTPCDELSKWQGCIRLVYSDDEANAIVPLGGAMFDTHEAMDRNWASIPEHCGRDDEPYFLADYHAPNGDILKDKRVSRQTCEQLTGRSVEQMIAEGKAHNLAQAIIATAQRRSRLHHENRLGSGDRTTAGVRAAKRSARGRK